MKKLLPVLILAFAILFGGVIRASAITCTNTFPASFNGYIPLQCIPSAWANAIETALGITNSTDPASLQYKVNHVTSTISTFVLQAANNLSDLPSTSSARTNIGFSAGSKISISATGVIGLTTTSISQFPNDAGYVTTSTGGSGTVGPVTSTQIAVANGTSTITSYAGLAWNNGSTTLTVSGGSGTSTLSVGTSTHPACGNFRDENDGGVTYFYTIGGVMFLNSSQPPC